MARYFNWIFSRRSYNLYIRRFAPVVRWFNNWWWSLALLSLSVNAQIISNDEWVPVSNGVELFNDSSVVLTSNEFSGYKFLRGSSAVGGGYTFELTAPLKVFIAVPSGTVQEQWWVNLGFSYTGPNFGTSWGGYFPWSTTLQPGVYNFLGSNGEINYIILADASVNGQCPWDSSLMSDDPLCVECQYVSGILASDPSCASLPRRTVSWTNPTKNTDGSLLTDLAGIYIYDADTDIKVWTHLSTVEGAHESVSFDSWTSCFYATAFNDSSSESSKSGVSCVESEEPLIYIARR